MHNIILNTDSYKTSHFLQYPPGTRYLSSYIEARGGEFKEALFFGLQMFIKAYLATPIQHADIQEAKAIYALHGVPFNEAGWQYIVDQHAGFLPIEIQALPEGTVIPVNNALVQVMNTDPNVPWLTGYIETALLRAIWYPTTVATQSYYCKKIIRRYLQETADTLDALPFKLHDFGARGTTAEESAAIGGAAHLVNFQGTDTVSAIVQARRFYAAEMAGFSIPAAEHSTMTCWGREHETDAYRNMIRQFGGQGNVFAVVSDSYDLFHAVEKLWAGELRDEVTGNGGTLVIRPDSGDPVTIVCSTIEKLMAEFGSRVNQKGYRVLPDFLRVIQGDGISRQSIEAILQALKAKNISADNISFGMGAELLQKLHRDTMKFAMKASAAEINGRWLDVYKDPITDQGKRSKRGRLAVIKGSNNGFKTIREDALKAQKNLLRPVFRNGTLLVDDDFATIRQRCQ